MIPLCLDLGVGIVPWSPLARGFLAGNRTREEHRPTNRAKTDKFAHLYYYQESDFDIVEWVLELAVQRNVTATQIALAWLLHKPGISHPSSVQPR